MNTLLDPRSLMIKHEYAPAPAQGPGPKACVVCITRLLSVPKVRSAYVVRSKVAFGLAQIR